MEYALVFVRHGAHYVAQPQEEILEEMFSF